MFAIGHFALGYLTGKGSSKALKTKINLPLLLAVSVIPDVDLLLEIVNPTVFMHRGLTHSLVTFTVFMIPFFIIYHRQAVPYYGALLSHSLIGDLFTGGVGLFWPISQDWFGNKWLAIGGLGDSVAELVLFIIAASLMFKAGDLQTLLHPKNHNFVLVIAFFAVLGPTLSFGAIESNLPISLLIPSLFWLIIFAVSLLIEFRDKLRKPPLTTVASFASEQQENDNEV
jgi:membrane-bound metal-dependent hydrolase YbcI (DUF457 family)